MATKSFSQTEIFRLKHRQDAIVIRADGHGTIELLEAILQFLPLDQYVESLSR